MSAIKQRFDAVAARKYTTRDTSQATRGTAAPAPAKTRPTDRELVEVLALHYRVHESSVVAWLLDIDFSEMEIAA